MSLNMKLFLNSKATQFFRNQLKSNFLKNGCIRYDFRSFHQDLNPMNMVNINGKIPTIREAISSGIISLTSEAYWKLKNSQLDKGDALSLSYAAAINSAKKTSELLILCHQVPLSKVEIKFDFKDDDHSLCVVAKVISQPCATGVEMESLVACTIAILNIYDCCKTISSDIKIRDIKLLKKTGGRRDYVVKS